MFKGVVIDADYLIFECTEGMTQERKVFTAEDGFTDTSCDVDMKPFKVKFKAKLAELLTEIYTSNPGEFEKDLDIKVLFSDPDGNFRYNLFPEYKATRKGKRSDEFYKLRAWALKKYGYTKGFEADDIVAYYVREHGYLGATMDKDLWSGVAGTWFNTHFQHRYTSVTNEEEARLFTLIQTVTGDATDNIIGLKGIGPVKAEKLLDKYGWDMIGVIRSYKEHGRDRYDAILNRRLIGMDQYNGKDLVLWSMSNE